jgi:hypothetical protein
MSIPNFLEDEQNLYDYISSRGLSVRKPNPVLRLRPHLSKPPMPESYRGAKTNYPYVMQAPENNPNFAFVGNRDTFEGNWHRIGDPITPENVGKTTYGAIGQDKTFGSQHHNVNLPRESNLTNEELQDRLRNFNLPSEGDRSSLFKRLINAQESPELMQKIGNGEAPTELEMADIVNRHEPINLQQAARLRELRKNQANNASMLSRLGTGSNPMTVNNLGAKGLASTGEAALGAEGAAASGATFASRAMPMMSLALMAGSLVQNSRANQQMKQDQEQQKSMRT